MGELSVAGGRDVPTVRFPAATPPDAADVLIVGAGPAVLDHDTAVHALELIATEVAPAPGRQPATEPAPAGV
ncbi:hypothetical protein ACIOKD_13545 [Streptomyces sp. NPDC087844]|uniref:hypothetical protein n=1 Tax=Streptomyces sp. NPDC087844 TaxID=3365805 RepID=UPI00380586D8